MDDNRQIPCKIYAFGSNGCGQLGIGHLHDVSNPKPCTWLGSEQATCPILVASGGNHTVLLDRDRSVWMAGGTEKLLRSICNQVEPLSAFRRAQFMHPYKFELLTRFNFISATWESITFVTDAGEVYTHGIGHKGELGLGGQCVETNRPQLMLSFPPDSTSIIDLAASMSHTVAVLENGEAWGWGAGRKGQLGKPCEIVWTPRKIEGIPFRVSRAVCGREYTYVLGSTPDEHMVIGSDKWNIKSTTVPSVGPWKALASSWSSIYILQSDGQLVRWGRNDKGQLGPDDLPLLEGIAVGSEHVVALACNGKLLAWGWGEHGNCGEQLDARGNVSGRWNEINVEEPVRPLGAGCATSFLVSRRLQGN